MATGGKKKYFYAYPDKVFYSKGSDSSDEVTPLYDELVDSDRLVIEAETNGEAVVLNKIAEAIVNGDYCFIISYIAGIVEDLYEDEHDFTKEYFHISYEELFNHMITNDTFDCKDERAAQRVFDKPQGKPTYLVNKESLRNAVEKCGLDTSVEKKLFGAFFMFKVFVSLIERYLRYTRFIIF